MPSLNSPLRILDSSAGHASLRQPADRLPTSALYLEEQKVSEDIQAMARVVAAPCSIRDLSAVFTSLSRKIFADALEPLVEDLLVLKGNAHLLLGFSAETIVARRLGGVVVGDCDQALDLMRSGAAPLTISNDAKVQLAAKVPRIVHESGNGNM
jgi:hypothetical protein